MQNKTTTDKIPVDIISGFLGSGKTTLLNRMLKSHYKGLNTAIIENEFGEVDVDSALLPEDIEITKITGGCVCCTLKVSLIEGIAKLIERFDLDRIVIETTGVAKLSDVISAVNNKALSGIAFSANNIAVINPKFHNELSSMLGSFYHDQIKNADIIYISRADITDKNVLGKTVESLREQNETCSIITGIDELVLKTQDAEAEAFEHEYHHEHHHHHHENADSEFESSYIDTDILKDEDELKALIDSIVNEAAPKTVFRIKGSVNVGGENTLLQYTNGELNISSASLSENRLVIITGK